MSKISEASRRFSYKLKHDYFSVENIALVAAVIMCLVWTCQSIEAMNRNWELTDRLNSEQRNLELLTIEVETAELENEYYASDEYQELSARKLAGKQLPGEHMVYLPENSVAAKNKHQIAEVVAVEEKNVETSNYQKWVEYLFP